MNEYYIIFPIFVELSKCEELEYFLVSFLETVILKGQVVSVIEPKFDFSGTDSVWDP